MDSNYNYELEQKTFQNLLFLLSYQFILHLEQQLNMVDKLQIHIVQVLED